MDDKDGKLNPNSTGDKQLNVLRKTDKEVVDNGNLVPKYEADDRLYKDLEDADYDPKTAAKRLKKRQDTEEKEVKDALKDKIENLTREQKEQLVREYLRRKIEHVLLEQTAEEPAIDATAPIAEPAPAVEPTAPAPEPTLDSETEEALISQKFVDSIKPEGTINQVKAIAKIAYELTKDVARGDAASFYKLIMDVAQDKLNKLTGGKE